MKSICTLDGLRSTTGCRRGIVAAAIPAHQHDFWMCCHPSSRGLCPSIRQHINHLMALHIYQDGAEFSPTAEREIIYSKLRYLSDRLCWERHDTTNDRGWRRLNRQTLRESGSQ